MKILVVNGPNLNLLGERTPEIYGTKTAAALSDELIRHALERGFKLEVFQSNHEGAMIDKLQSARDASALIINPGGLAHTSICLRDCIAELKIPVVEVHISNIFARERFRRESLISEVCLSVLSGFGTDGYVIAMDYLIGMITNKALPRPDKGR